MYDLAIIGAGPGGMTAALYARRYGLDVVVLSEEIGGLCNEAHIVENWPGTKSIMGSELAEKMRDQIESVGVKIVETRVKSVDSENDIFKVVTDSGDYDSKSVILAMGTKKRRLGLEDEERFIGKGVSYCTTCDAPLYKGANVAVVGGNDSAAKSALHLAEHAAVVYIIYRRDELRAEKMLKERCEKNEKIEIVYNSVPVELKGDKLLESVVLDNGDSLEVEGLFVEIGSVPNESIKHIGADKIKREEKYVDVDADMSTNIEGVFAAGDITTYSNRFQQMITAAAEGAIAARTAYEYVRSVF